MDSPTVCAIMITANRPELAKRAVECFQKQTYQNKRLLILDTSLDVVTLASHENVVHAIQPPGPAIGTLRNDANWLALSELWLTKPDILIHWDDDDWSRSARIAEQVALLKQSDADCVGYREMLFWREPQFTEANYRQEVSGEAWLYRNPEHGYALGTSLCYWARVWQARPFAATSSGEDERFIRGLRVVGVPAFNGPGVWPRMIARIHGSNTSSAYSLDSMEREARRANNPMWSRVPEWDKYCHEVMECGT